MTTFCRKCGARNEPDARFCESCGSPMPVSMQPAADVAPQAPSAEHQGRLQQPRRGWVLYAVGALAILGIGIGVAVFFAPMGPLAGLASTLRGLGVTGGETTLYYVGRNGKWGYVNKAGSEVISFQYDRPTDSNWNYSVIRRAAPYPVLKNGKWMLVSRDGAPLGQRVMDEMQSIPQSPTVCGRVGKHWGCVDAAGRDAIPFKYEAVGRTLEGLTAVKSNGRWGYVDTAGTVVIQPSFLEARDFEHGLVSVKFDDENWGLIDATGKEVSKRRYKIASNPGDGVWTAWEGTNSVITDLTGEIKQRLDNVLIMGIFHEGLATTLWRNTGEAHLIDTSGKIVNTVPLSGYPGSFSNGLASVSQSWGVVAVGAVWDHAFGFIRKDGRYVVPPLFDAPGDFVDGVAIVQKGTEAWTIDLSGRAIWPKEKQAIAAPTKDLDYLKNWKWRIQKMSGDSNDLIGATIEFGADTVHIDTGQGPRKIRYQSREAGILQLTINGEPADWEFLAYGNEAVVFGRSDRSAMLLTRTERMGNEREKTSGAKEPNAQGNSLFSGLPALFGRSAGGGAGNTTSMDACKSLVAALVAGDREGVQRFNRSSDHAWPTPHLMENVSPSFQDAGSKNITFKQLDDRTVLVRFINGNPNSQNEWRFKFLKEKDGYFFVSLGLS